MNTSETAGVTTGAVTSRDGPRTGYRPPGQGPDATVTQAGPRRRLLTVPGVTGIAFMLSWIAFFQVAAGATAHVPVGEWFTSGKLAVDWALRIDTLTAVMLVVVTTVSFLVHVYSIGYMHEDPSRPRFFAYLSLFTFAMLMLVTADNLV